MIEFSGVDSSTIIKYPNETWRMLSNDSRTMILVDDNNNFIDPLPARVFLRLVSGIIVVCSSSSLSAAVALVSRLTVEYFWGAFMATLSLSTTWHCRCSLWSRAVLRSSLACLARVTPKWTVLPWRLTWRWWWLPPDCANSISSRELSTWKKACLPVTRGEEETRKLKNLIIILRMLRYDYE